MADLNYEEPVVDNGNREYSPERTPVKPSRRSRSRSRSPIRRSRSRSPRRRRSVNLMSKRVMVSNIPYEMKWQHIKDIFRKEVGDVSYVNMFETPDGKSSGSCVVEMKTMDLTRKAIEVMHKFKVKDRFLTVREERESDLRRQEMYGGGGGGGMGNMSQGGGGNVGLGMGGGGMGGGGMGGGGMGGGGMGGGGVGGGVGMVGSQNMGMGGPINNRILQQLGIEGPLSNTVFIHNLDFRVTWRKLKDVFKLAGNAIKADIKVDKDGKSRGLGTVQFETPLEAVQAISMFNGQTLYDRQMMVRIDKTEEPKPPAPRLPSGLRSIGMGLGIGGAPLQNLSQLPGGMDSGIRGGGSGGMGGGFGSMSGMGGMGSMDMGGGMSSMGVGMSGSMGGLSGSMGGLSGNMGGMSGNVGGLSSSMGGMSGGLGGMGSGSSSLGGSMGMGGGMGGMSGGMGMGSSLGGMGGSLGMSDNFSSGMGGMSSNLGSGMGGGMKDSMGGMGSMGGSMMNSSMGAWGSANIGSSGMSSNSGDSGHYGNYGLNDRRGSSGLTRPDNCTVIVKNLPYSFTWQTLKDRFQDVGKVKFAEIEKENGRSSGVGYVRFGNPGDAERAVTVMNRARMESREILVRPYRN
ncbi:myelin expression factor 2-like isoform X1 [Gigantopelta aegis]|uniref:myelin expression factor 2-like isoform X1 n=1 Tax=Gigantopelta aegis TaxID=1735272 RepID=UPI001B88D163|nr:myelin expression factor 2-like isoform X1 [Gigantopelta aegis]